MTLAASLRDGAVPSDQLPAASHLPVTPFQLFVIATPRMVPLLMREDLKWRPPPVPSMTPLLTVGPLKSTMVPPMGATVPRLLAVPLMVRLPAQSAWTVAPGSMRRLPLIVPQ